MKKNVFYLLSVVLLCFSLSFPVASFADGVSEDVEKRMRKIVAYIDREKEVFGSVEAIPQFNIVREFLGLPVFFKEADLSKDVSGMYLSKVLEYYKKYRAFMDFDFNFDDDKKGEEKAPDTISSDGSTNEDEEVVSSSVVDHSSFSFRKLLSEKEFGEMTESLDDLQNTIIEQKISRLDIIIGHLEKLKSSIGRQIEILKNSFLKELSLLGIGKSKKKEPNKNTKQLKEKHKDLMEELKKKLNEITKDLSETREKKAKLQEKTIEKKAPQKPDYTIQP